MRFSEPIAARFDQFRVNEKRVARKNWFAKFHFISAHEITDPARAFRQLHQQNACDLRHRFDLKNAGHHRVPRKVPLKKRLVDGDVLDRLDMLSRSALDHFVDEKKRRPGYREEALPDRQPECRRVR